MINETNTELSVELPDARQQRIARWSRWDDDGDSIYDLLGTSL